MDLAALLETQPVLDETDLALLIDGIATGVVLLRSTGATFGHIGPADVARTPDGEFTVAAPIGSAAEFTAPEVARRPGNDTPRSDVFSASAVVARAAFGPRWRDASAGSDPLAFELGRGLELDPAERHSSLSAWRESVGRALDERREIREPTVTRQRSTTSTVAGVVVAVLVIAALIAALIPIDTDNSPPIDERPPATQGDEGRPLEA